jgi:hypothetical protein
MMVVALLGSLFGCTPPEPHPVLASLAPEALEIPLAEYVAPAQSASFIIENQGASTLFVTAAADRATGVGAELLRVDLPPFTAVAPAQRFPVRVTLDDRRWLWDSGTFTVQFPIEVRYYFSGQAEDEPEPVSATTPPEPQAEIRTVAITFSIACDLDGDGREALDCGGDDCDDEDRDIAPGKVEVCDLVDQDCDGAVDEGAVDLKQWYPDVDGDGFGDASAAVTACSKPGGPVAWIDDRGTDCDDSDERINPDAFETCDDGIDNNCNRRLDCRDSQCRDQVVCQP